MAQLGIGVEFLHEFSRLEPPVRRRTVEAVEKFSEHTHAGLHLEKLTNPRDSRVRTIRIDQFWRGVVLAPDTGDQFVLLRVLPHDDAIAWARTRRFSVNPVSGVLEVRDVVALEELTETGPSPAVPARLFEGVRDSDLRRLGLDDQVLAVARTLVDEAALHAVSPLLPEQQADVLAALAAGYEVEQVWADVVAPRIPDDPIHPDDLAAAVDRSRGRIALVEGPDDLIALFDRPMALWRVFLHPSQEEIAYRPSYWGSAQVTGGPGTGKTVVALHRVKHLVDNRQLQPHAVLLTSYNRGLAESLDRDLARLLDADQRTAVLVQNIDRWARSVVTAAHGAVRIAKDDEVRDRLQRAATEAGATFSPAFLREEWEQVVLANDVRTEDGYLTAPRRGRGRGLTKGQKRSVWAALSRLVDGLRADHLWTFLTVADEAARLVAARPTPPFRHVVVDEIQDLHPAQWRLLRAAVAVGPDDLFLTGDPHQRIYGNHVSLRTVGISVAGRSSRLRINYRTSAEILQWSMGVLGDIAVADLDDGLDSLTGYRSALHGEPPELSPAASPAHEAEGLALALLQWHDEGVAWGDIAVVARTRRIVQRVTQELQAHGIRTSELGGAMAPDDAVRVGTMHGMKGLEFRCVAVVGAGRDTLPLRPAVTPLTEDPVRHALDLQQERCLLFVACTRARERLRVSWSGDRSPLVPA
ncbi:MAG: UvrD-helicase domain-containing protein [Pseudonocardia sp.]